MCKIKPKLIEKDWIGIKLQWHNKVYYIGFVSLRRENLLDKIIMDN